MGVLLLLIWVVSFQAHICSCFVLHEASCEGNSNWHSRFQKDIF